MPVVERKELILARRIPARVVLRLTSSNLSLNVIASALHASKVGITLSFLHGEYREDAPRGARRRCPTTASASGTGSSRSAGTS